MVVRKKPAKKVEDKLFVLNDLDFSFIENVFLELSTRYEVSWEDNNTAEFKKDEKSVGRILMDNKEMTVEGKELIALVKKFFKLAENNKKKPLGSEDVINSPIPKMLSDSRAFFGLDKNREAFKKSCEALKEAGIDKFLTNEHLSHASSIFDKLTVIWNPSCDRSVCEEQPDGYTTRLRNILVEQFKLPESYKTNHQVVGDRNYYLLKTLPDEKTYPIEIKNYKIGNYYPERNLILLLFNPFSLEKTSMFSDDIPRGVTHLISLVQKLGAKTIKGSSLAEKIFVESFLENTNRKISDKKRNLKDFERRIDSYEKEIRGAVQRIQEDQILIEHLETLVESGGKTLFSELEEAKKLPFVKELTTDAGNIKVTFNETCIDVPQFRRGDHRENLGKRTFYLGEITMNISPSNFTVMNTNSINGHSHPHSSGDEGGPCFGDGDGSRKIYETLASCRITELMKLLWFWVKTYRNNGAYVKQYVTYDDRLKKGFPVWDDKGNRIEINEKARLESGEQVKLEKEACYDDNVKRFADVTKPFYQ